MFYLFYLFYLFFVSFRSSFYYFFLTTTETKTQLQPTPAVEPLTYTQSVHILNQEQQLAQNQCKELLQGETATWKCTMAGRVADINAVPGDIVKQERPPTAGTLTGTSFTPHDFTSDESDPQALIVVVDGGAPQTIRVVAKCETLVSCAAALTAQINGATVSDDGSTLRITSDTTGVSSTIAIAPEGSSDAALALFGVNPFVEAGYGRRDWIGEFATVKETDDPEQVMVVFTSAPDQQFTVTKNMFVGDSNQVDACDLLRLALAKDKNTIRFQQNSTVILDECEHIVRKIVIILNRFGHIHIRVDGHVHLTKKARKDPEKVKQARVLSALRAGAILQLLVSGGVSANRMTAKGFGGDCPLPKGQDDKRVEITVIEQLDPDDGAPEVLDTNDISIEVFAGSPHKTVAC